MGRILYGPLLGPERDMPLMDRINYGPTFGPKHGSQLMGWPTRVLKILWAYSWADPLMSAQSRGPLVGPAHYDPQEFCGPLPGPAHYGTQKSCGPLPGPAYYGPRNLVDL